LASFCAFWFSGWGWEVRRPGAARLVILGFWNPVWERREARAGRDGMERSRTRLPHCRPSGVGVRRVGSGKTAERLEIQSRGAWDRGAASGSWGARAWSMYACCAARLAGCRRAPDSGRGMRSVRFTAPLVARRTTRSDPAWRCFARVREGPGGQGGVPRRRRTADRSTRAYGSL
jgi:hypothetical protein